jgi:hypothetical protein
VVLDDMLRGSGAVCLVEEVSDVQVHGLSDFSCHMGSGLAIGSHIPHRTPRRKKPRILRGGELRKELGKRGGWSHIARHIQRPFHKGHTGGGLVVEIDRESSFDEVLIALLVEVLS